MIYKKVAKIEEELSAVGMGCWNFGGDWDTSDENNAISIIHSAIDAGINLFDVAPVYGYGISETILGKALKDGKRNQVLLCSKCGLRWNENRETRNDLTKASILEEIDDSLTRLQTDHIDLYQLHWPDPSTSLEETADALAEIQKAGKIRYIGLTNFSVKDAETLMSMIDIHSQQGLYNMLERNPESYHNIPLEYRTEKEIFPMVKKHGQAFLPYSPLFQGLLTGKFKEGQNFSQKDVRSANPKLAGENFHLYLGAANQLKAFAQEIGRPMNEMALNWLRQHEEITSIIGGASKLSQLEGNVHSTTWDLTQEELNKINEIIAPFENL